MRAATIPITAPAWSDFVSSHPDATPFHLPGWALTIADCYGFEASALVVRDTDDEILAGIPTLAVRSPLGGVRWVSLPFTDRCTLLTRPGTDEEQIVEALREAVSSGHVRELEIRAGLPSSDGLYPVEVGYLHTMELPQDSAQLRPNKGHRHSRNRAIRDGITVTRDAPTADFRDFYKLQSLTRRRLGVPVQPRRFFGLMWEHLIAKGEGFVMTATLDGELLAKGVYLGHNGTLVAKYYASDPRQPANRASYLIDWETMVAACGDGYHTFDMGRSDPEADGLRLYKSSWGMTETPLVYTTISTTPIGQRSALRTGGMSRQILQRSPVWVCQAIGEVLYRWTA
jgi:CelD/BcsL family acetyltransferase involved in cellulose biosynthesis